MEDERESVVYEGTTWYQGDYAMDDLGYLYQLWVYHWGSNRTEWAWSTMGTYNDFVLDQPAGPTLPIRKVYLYVEGDDGAKVPAQVSLRGKSPQG